MHAASRMLRIDTESKSSSNIIATIVATVCNRVRIQLRAIADQTSNNRHATTSGRDKPHPVPPLTSIPTLLSISGHTYKRPLFVSDLSLSHPSLQLNAAPSSLPGSRPRADTPRESVSRRPSRLP